MVETFGLSQLKCEEDIVNVIVKINRQKIPEIIYIIFL